MNQITGPLPDQQQFHYVLAGSNDDTAQSRGFSSRAFIFQATLELKSTFKHHPLF